MESLAISSASSKSEKRLTVATGPKISSHQTFASVGGLAITVGARQRPSSTSSPPVSTSAPAAAASSIHSLTRSRSSGEISGPTSVSESSGSPTVSPSTLETKRLVKSSAIASWTRMRWIEMQLWPACEKAWICALSAAVSQSPSSLTISGALEPSSRLTFLCGTEERMSQPTSAEPVKVSARVSSCSTIALPTSLPGPGIDVQPAVGHAGLGQDLGQLQRRDRRLPGRLQDHRVAGRERGAELVGDEVEREVEGADRADDPVGHAHHDAELARAGRRRRPSAPSRRSACGLDGGEGQGVDAAARLDLRGLHRLAGLGGDRQRQVVDPLGDQARGAVERRGALVTGELVGVEGFVGGVDGALDQLGVADRDPPTTVPS